MNLQELAKEIEQYDSFLLLSHIRPDGDAIGSQLALGDALERLGKTVIYYNEDGCPSNLTFLKGSEKVQQSTPEPVNVDAVIALDTAKHDRVGPNSLKAGEQVPVWFNIDHHPSNPEYGTVNYIDGTSPATGQIIYELVQAGGWKLGEQGQMAAYVGISTDTGSFQYPATTSKTYRIAADIIDDGLNVGAVNSATYGEQPYRKVQLLKHLLNTLEVEHNGLIAHWFLTAQVKEELQLQPEDSEDLIDIIRSIEGVKVALFFEEISSDSNEIRVSMRSKTPTINASEICQSFGGGGHALAAGIRMDGPLVTARDQVIAKIIEVAK